MSRMPYELGPSELISPLPRSEITSLFAWVPRSFALSDLAHELLASRLRLLQVRRRLSSFPRTVALFFLLAPSQLLACCSTLVLVPRSRSLLLRRLVSLFLPRETGST